MNDEKFICRGKKDQRNFLEYILKQNFLVEKVQQLFTNSTIRAAFSVLAALFASDKTKVDF